MFAFLRRLYWNYFSQPASDRPLYRSVLERVPRVILVVGLKRGERTAALLRLAVQSTKNNTADEAALRLICADPFEGRTEDDGPGLSLRKAHKVLSMTGANVRCVPGPPEIGIAQVSRSERNIDLVLLSTPHYNWLATSGELLLAALTDDAIIFVEQDGKIVEKTREMFAGELAAMKKHSRTSKAA
ncbi:MAG: hypothetical protein ACRC46_14615 [Thermoguttaceae bacterium]